MFRKSPVLRKEDHLHSQVPLKCRLHRAETSSCCCKAVLLAVANSAAAASGANATLQKKKNRYSGEIAAFNTSKGAVNIGLEKVSKLSCPTCCSEPRGQRGCWLHWNQFLERADRIYSSADELKWVRRRRGFSWDGERCWQGAVLLVLGFAGSGVDSLPVTSI